MKFGPEGGMFARLEFAHSNFKMVTTQEDWISIVAPSLIFDWALDLALSSIEQGEGI